MTFYEVHDEDGCLAKTRQFKVAKQSALAFLTMKSGRRLQIRMYAGDTGNPQTAIELDPATRTWSKPEPLALGSAAAS